MKTADNDRVNTPSGEKKSCRQHRKRFLQYCQ